MKYLVLLLITIMFASGCATQGISSHSYSDPSGPSLAPVKNEVTVAKSYGEVWDGLVKELAKSFYVINNIDKESRIVNLSFSTNSPAEYIDCGRTRRVYTEGDKEEVFDYEVAGSSTFKYALTSPHPAWARYAMVNRQTSLEGRTNIYVAPNEKEKNSTNVTVNARYILTIKTSGDVYSKHSAGAVNHITRTPQESNTFTTNTNKPERNAAGVEYVTCVSKGKLEEEILRMAVK